MTNLPDYCILYIRYGRITIIDAEEYQRVAAYSWSIRPDGYVARNPGNGGTMYLHRFILNARDGDIVDHRNRDPLDNRKANLRFVDALASAMNTGPRPGSSKFKGVSWHTARQNWRAILCTAGTHRYLGSFDDEEEAARRYDAAVREYCGEGAYLNFPG